MSTNSSSIAVLSWPYAITCLAPAWLVALVVVNVQNYYEHFGANPDERHTNSVSYYARLYNLLTFNDGYHQEHHLAPSAHWSALPSVRDQYASELAAGRRVISRWPAWLGFLDRRPLLHLTDREDHGVGMERSAR